MKPDRPVPAREAEPVILGFPSRIDLVAEVDCPDCSRPLSVSQPDMDLPERLLGICERCKHWFVLDLVGERVRRFATD